MAADASPTSIIEHVVLINISDPEPTSMITSLHTLNSLPHVLHLTAGPIFRLHVTPSTSPRTFTHIIHARFPSESDLSAYFIHPAHQAIVDDNRAICLDFMALDWAVPSFPGPIALHPGRAMRLTFYKLREGVEKGKFVEELGVISEKLAGVVEEFTFGENFGVGREKGFGVASNVVFRDLNELDAAELYEDLVRTLVERFKGVVDEILTVDYLVPRVHVSGGPTLV